MVSQRRGFFTVCLTVLSLMAFAAAGAAQSTHTSKRFSGAKVNDGLRESFWLMGMEGGIKGEYDCIREFSEVDYTKDLKKIDKPTLVIHGDDDQIVPIAASAEKTVKIVKGAELKVYKGGSHGLAQVDPDTFNTDVLAFIRA